MKTYGKFRPTGFDPAGAFLPDQQDWLVLPVSRTRDTGAFSDSNFEVALKMLGGERNNIVEVHRFGHWGRGWFEIIIVNPRAGKTRKIAEAIESALEDYPILDEMDLSEREREEQEESWDNWVRSDFMRELESKFHEDTLPAYITEHFEYIEDMLEHLDDNDNLYELFHDFAEITNTYWETESDGGQYIRVSDIVEGVTLEDIWEYTKPGKTEKKNKEKQYKLLGETKP